MAMFPALMNDAFHDMFDDPFFSRWTDAPERMLTGVSSPSLMKTDVRENDNNYEVAIDMPGFNKDDIKVDLHDGYLTVSAHKDEDGGDKDENGKWLRRERYVGSASRNFYVGNQLREDDVRANYKDGTLHLEIAKKDSQRKVEEGHHIAIEG